MKKGSGRFEPQGLLIAYKELGTIHIDEFAQAIMTDLHVLKENYHVQFVRTARLKLTITDEYGDELTLHRPTGGVMHFMHTAHYRPACKDYEL